MRPSHNSRRRSRNKTAINGRIPSVSSRLSIVIVQKSGGKVLALPFWGCQLIIIIDFLDKGSIIIVNHNSALLAKKKQAVGYFSRIGSDLAN